MKIRITSRTTEIACWVLGAALLLTFFGARTWGELERQQAITQFAEARAQAAIAALASVPVDAVAGAAAAAEGFATPVEPLAAHPPPDQAQWSDSRVRAYESEVEESIATELLPTAVLRIGRVRLEVPVYTDTTERNLNRGAGLVEGTALPGSEGNIAIAAHRDGYFRVLKDVTVGDLLELESLSDQRSYRITEIYIVEPTDVSPLHATNEPTVTLVTCYPFYFVGNAPQRFIVRAVAVEF
jgi:sortase A